MTQPILTDFPKVECPFIREVFAVDKVLWKKHGPRLGLRQPEAYLVTKKVNPGFEWVFDDPDTIAVEKLDGTNVKIKTEKGRLITVQNRLNVIDPLQVIKGQGAPIMEGIFSAIGKGYLPLDGELAGEVIGPKLQGNPYKLDLHLWFPFERSVSDLSYRSFHEHSRTFENWSIWFKDGLHSRFFAKRASKLGLDERVFAEGVVFYNLKRRSENKSWMAKLRRDMFAWYYESEVPILDYSPEGKQS